jgi:hypothetical protein
MHHPAVEECRSEDPPPFTGFHQEIRLRKCLEEPSVCIWRQQSDDEDRRCDSDDRKGHGGGLERWASE